MSRWIVQEELLMLNDVTEWPSWEIAALSPIPDPIDPVWSWERSHSRG